MENGNLANLNSASLLGGSLEPGNRSLPIKSKEVDEVEQIDYVPVPPRRSIAVSVRYHFRGRGQPLPYPLDEEMDE